MLPRANPQSSSESPVSSKAQTYSAYIGGIDRQGDGLWPGWKNRLTYSTSRVEDTTRAHSTDSITQAFSRLIFDKKKNRYYAQPDDLTEVYVFGRPNEKVESLDNPTSIIAGADGKLYIAGNWQSCARYDPAKQSVEWVRMTWVWLCCYR